MKKALLPFNIILTAFVLSSIVYFSSRDGGQTASESLGLTDHIANFIYRNGYSPEQYHRIHMAIRVFAHISLYSALGAVSGLWAQYAARRFPIKRSFIIALASCALIGFSDEWLKQYVPGRHFDMRDVATNIASAAVGLSAVLGLAAILGRKTDSNGRSKAALPRLCEGRSDAAIQEDGEQGQ